ncbi:GNAT family N-acetyltransferase [Marinobacter sp. OP 3.4]|uniref:GNAT family N-acetyltransferase n=1 Tax=Marinobacter sp. OP 3.4 TaxID=3076501 RepID=UPI002E1E6BCC
MTLQTYMDLSPHYTSRLMLRPFLERDTDELYAIQSDQQAMRHTFAATSLQQCAQRLKTFEDMRDSHGFAPWVVCDRSETEVIGWGGLNIDPFDPGWGVEVSYFFDPAHWGRGFATELVLALKE